MKMLRTLFWLRWRLLVNESESRGLFFAALLLLLMLFAGTGAAIGFVLRHPELLHVTTEQQWLRLSNGVLHFLFLFTIVFMIISSGSLFKWLDPAKLRHYPFTSLASAIYEIVIGSLNVWQFGFASFLAGYCIILVLHSASIIRLFEVLVIVLTSVVIVQITAEVLRATFAALKLIPIKFRYGLLIGAAAVLSWVLSTLSVNPAIDVQWTPFGLLSAALYGISFNTEHATLSIAFADFLGISFLTFFVYMAIRRTNIAHYEVNSNRFSRRKLKERYSMLEGIISVFPDRIAPQVRKEILCIYRSKMARRSFLVSLFILCIIGFQFLVEEANPQKNFFIIFFFALFMPLIGWEQFFSNCFGPDGRSFNFYLFTSITPKSLFISKNISVVVAMFPALIFFWVVVACIFSIEWLIYVIPAQSSVLLLLLSFSNGTSIRYAYPVDLNAPATSSATNYSLYTLLKMAVCGALSFAITLFLWHFKVSWVSTLFLVSLVSVMVFAYKKSLLSASELFLEHSEEIYLKLRKA